MHHERSRYRFATTRWSVVLAARGATPASREALAVLCDANWHPVYAFALRSGFTKDDASDLTQAFFVRIIEKQALLHARPDRGRFRSFLLGSFQHFILNELDRKNALERGRGIAHLPLATESDESRCGLDPVDNVTPQDVFEREWAAGILTRAMARLAASWKRDGQEALFEKLKPRLTDDSPPPYHELANLTGLTEAALRTKLSRLREEWRRMLRATVAETVERREDIGDELRFLLDVVSRWSSGR